MSLRSLILAAVLLGAAMEVVGQYNGRSGPFSDFWNAITATQRTYIQNIFNNATLTKAQKNAALASYIKTLPAAAQQADYNARMEWQNIRNGAIQARSGASIAAQAIMSKLQAVYDNSTIKAATENAQINAILRTATPTVMRELYDNCAVPQTSF
ncbi:hypothetical protein AAVH_39060 [Aphelenchoides avenae]|nr:hypothetical protein AAVH_39060 [Aphelenchus avenae]